MSETAIRNGTRLAALVLNAALFATGVYFEVHPRDRRDLWSAAAVAAVAVLNSAALTIPASGQGARLMLRLRRIALLANAILVVTALGIVAIEGLQDWRHMAVHGIGLVVPPLLTLLALRDVMASLAPAAGATRDDTDGREDRWA